ncbi:ABC transporter permease [Ulvibacter litoralis]|uniref:ABC-2 type transport system permease protein n=1 Tax=Ulvibacter litoralis TaxID=227084 RepID=A0A1G7I9X1_9FLAO|nr:ABC transporter permease [Ulvibacter litoralis]SDF09510.1 ABC-2 type transport system permease protein [Ulvibacter litoralis]
MRTIRFLLVKEFKQIFRNKAMLLIIFVLPLIQLLILSNAASYEVKNSKFAIVDLDHSSYSRALIQKFEASSQFDFMGLFSSEKIAKEQMQQGKIDVVLYIPVHFERSFQKEKKGSLLTTINAINGSAAAVENMYVNAILKDFNKTIQVDFMGAEASLQPKQLHIDTLFWFNPELNYKTFMVPGILVLLVTMVALFLAGMNIVREKELGTLEQINVTPIKKHQFIIGKLLPFWIIGMFELAVGLVIARLIFDVPMVGNFGLLFLFASVYLLVILGIGMFISNFTDTQQQAMFLSWFFAVIFILMSGLFTPIESMPAWAQVLTEANPVKYFVEVVRMVMLKGASLLDIMPQLIKLSIYALLINTLAVWSYKKVN